MQFDSLEEEVRELRYKNEMLTKKNNHGRGKCNRVVVVFKWDVSVGDYKLEAVAQNLKVAAGIRSKYIEEAHKFNIDPNKYVWFKDYPVVWSKSIFPDRYKIYDVDNKKTIFTQRMDRGDGYYSKYNMAKYVATKMKEEGKIGNWVIQKYNRKTKHWDVVTAPNKVSKLKKFN